MQRVQNMCACLVLRRTKWESAMECLATLHWLPIRQQIKFKLCVLTYKLLHQQGPKYLQELIQYRSTDNRLRSSADPYLLIIHKTKYKTFTARSFSISAPTTWNGLPYHVRTSDNILTFKSGLKTHLYHEAFGSCTPQNP